MATDVYTAAKLTYKQTQAVNDGDGIHLYINVGNRCLQSMALTMEVEPGSIKTVFSSGRAVEAGGIVLSRNEIRIREVEGTALWEYLIIGYIGYLCYADRVQASEGRSIEGTEDLFIPVSNFEGNSITMYNGGCSTQEP